MTAAFDLKDLETRLLAKGLPSLEPLAEVCATEVLSWLGESLALEASTNSLFAIGVPVIAALTPVALEAIKKVMAPTPVPPAA